MDDTRETLDPDAASRLTEFARACKAAVARRLALSSGTPGDRRHARSADRADRRHDHRRARSRSTCGQAPFTSATLRPGKPDAAVVELSELLRRQLDRLADAQRRRRRRLVADLADAAGAIPGRRPRRRRHRPSLGERPAARASRSRRSTTRRSCAKSRGTRRRSKSVIAAALAGPTSSSTSRGDASRCSRSSAIRSASTS